MAIPKPSKEAEEPIRKMRQEGKSWSEVSDWITRQVGYNTDLVAWARKVYNDEASQEKQERR